MGLFADRYMMRYWSTKEQQKNKDEPSPSEPMVEALLIMHIISYVCHYFKVHDISKNGVPDVNGVYYAKRESAVGNVETFMICILFGFCLKHIVDIGADNMHDNCFLIYLMIFDSFIMFTMKGYIYMSKMMYRRSQVTKNIFSLYFVQKRWLEAKEKQDLEALKQGLGVFDSKAKVKIHDGHVHIGSQVFHEHGDHHHAEGKDHKHGHDDHGHDDQSDGAEAGPLICTK